MSTAGSTELRAAVLAANRLIPEAGLAALTWGNVSGVDRERGHLRDQAPGCGRTRISPLDLLCPGGSGDRAGPSPATLRPSVDSETHRAVLPGAALFIGGVTHTHSTHAVAFAQAGRDVPRCSAPRTPTPSPARSRVTRDLTADECAHDYEFNSGARDHRTVRGGRLSRRWPTRSPSPPTTAPSLWGGEPPSSRWRTAIVCEAVAEMALKTLSLNTAAEPRRAAVAGPPLHP